MTAGNVILDINVIDVEREKLNPSRMAREILEATRNGELLPPEHIETVSLFLDPAFSTENIELLEKFIKVYEDSLAGVYSKSGNPIYVDEDGFVKWRGRIVRKFNDHKFALTEEGVAALDRLLSLCTEIEESGGEVSIISLAQLETKKAAKLSIGAPTGTGIGVEEDTLENNAIIDPPGTIPGRGM